MRYCVWKKLRETNGVGGGNQALNKRERSGTALQHQRIQPRKHTIIITMRGVVWLILSDWPQVPVLSQYRSSQREKKSSVLFQPPPVNGKKKHYLNAITGKLVQTCSGVRQLHTALITVALQSSHSTGDCIFTQIRHLEDKELSFFLSFCLCFFYIWLQGYANIPGWCSAIPKRRGGAQAQEEALLFGAVPNKDRNIFYEWCKKMTANFKKRFDQQMRKGRMIRRRGCGWCIPALLIPGLLACQSHNYYTVFIYSIFH